MENQTFDIHLEKVNTHSETFSNKYNLWVFSFKKKKKKKKQQQLQFLSKICYPIQLGTYITLVSMCILLSVVLWFLPCYFVTLCFLVKVFEKYPFLRLKAFFPAFLRGRAHQPQPHLLSQTTLLRVQRLWVVFSFVCFVLSFQGHSHRTWRFPGQEWNQSCSCQPTPQPLQCRI